MGNKIETKDVLGESVICSNDAWFGHLTVHHPIMKNNADAVKDTIEDPEAIHKSAENDNRKVYFKRSSKSTYNNHLYTKVITETIEDNKSEIISAWPQKSITGGIGDEIYRK